MGCGKWSRWGRGSCEGYSLEFGCLFRFDIRPGPRSGVYPDLWHASSRAQSLGDFPTFEAAADACEAQARQLIESATERGEFRGDMVLVLDQLEGVSRIEEQEPALASSTKLAARTRITARLRRWCG